ncbi:hemolysin D [Marivirga lumbricoides]|uniref:Hemolysin D n=2 Tax=Marivirga lumbricoides TaxID=1046115 RepID=A0ABQ1LDN1_9BACT|nr:hemolysin D [Marivirga lumbricoides]
MANENLNQAKEENIYEITKKQFQSASMELGQLEKTAFHEVVQARGMFDVPPENKAAVSCYFGGTVKSIKLLPGEKVKKGQVLFMLENPDYVQIQQDFLEAQGQLSYLKADYERQKNLAKDSVTSQKNFAKAESDYRVTSAKVKGLSKKLALMNINPHTLTVENISTTIPILSPIAGYVTEVAISRGAFLTPSQLAVSLVDPDHIHLELNIFEKDLAKVSVGQSIRFSIQEDKSASYEATVHLVNKTIGQENRTVGIHGHLADEKLAAQFNPGMYIEAEIFTNTEEKSALPKEAVVELDNKYYALVLKDSSATAYTFQRTEVKTGLSNNERMEVLNTSAFDENTQFLTRGAFNLITE